MTRPTRKPRHGIPRARRLPVRAIPHVTRYLERSIGEFEDLYDSALFGYRITSPTSAPESRSNASSEPTGSQTARERQRLT